MKMKRTIAILMATILVLALVLTACGPSSAPASGENTPAAPAGSSAPATTTTGAKEIALAGQASDYTYDANGLMTDNGVIKLDRDVGDAVMGSDLPKYTIGLLNPLIGNTWRAQEFQDVDAAVDMYKGRLNDFIIATSNNDATQQLAQMNQMINQGVDCILLDAVSATALESGVEKAQDAGILVMELLGSSYYDLVNYVHDVDMFCNINTGWLINKIGDGKNVVHITGLVGSPLDEARVKVNKEIFKAHNINVLGEAPANWNETEAQSVMEQFISTFGDRIDGVVQQDVTAPGVLRAYDVAGMDPAPMTGDTKYGFLRDWEEMGLDSIGVCLHQGLYIDSLGIAIRLLDGWELDPAVLEENDFVEGAMNQINSEPPYVVTTNGDASTLPAYQAEHFISTKDINVHDAVAKGEGRSAEVTLDGYLNAESMAKLFTSQGTYTYGK